MLSEEEVLRLLEAAVSLRDKLLFGLMYVKSLRPKLWTFAAFWSVLVTIGDSRIVERSGT